MSQQEQQQGGASPADSSAPDAVDADVLEFFDGLDDGGEVGEEAPPAPAPAGVSGQREEADGVAPEDAKFVQTWGKLQDVKRRQDMRDAALKEREAKLAELEKATEDPVAAFRAAATAKYGEEGAKALIDRFVLQQISESIPELKDQLPADLKYNTEIGETKAQIAALERQLAERDAREAAAKQQAEADAKLSEAKSVLGDWWKREGEKGHPHLAVEDDPIEMIVEYMQVNPKVDVATAVRQLEELHAKKAAKYKRLFGAEGDILDRVAAPRQAPAAPRQAPSPTPLTGAPSSSGRKRFEDMDDDESAAAIVAALERGEKLV